MLTTRPSKPLCTSDTRNTHRCSDLKYSMYHANGRVQTVWPTDHFMGLICTGKKIRDGVVCIASMLRAGRSVAQIPILAIDSYLLQEL
jgi:hypothetical protein